MVYELYRFRLYLGIMAIPKYFQDLLPFQKKSWNIVVVVGRFVVVFINIWQITK